MKNVMVVDGALNCAYDVFQFTENEFELAFPEEGQDVAFIDEILSSNSDPAILDNAWERPMDRKAVNGIHGILFYELESKKEFYPNRKDSDLNGSGRAKR